MPCSCNNSKEYVVTTSSGDKIPVTSETEAKTLATRTGGSYRLK